MGDRIYCARTPTKSRSANNLYLKELDEKQVSAVILFNERRKSSRENHKGKDPKIVDLKVPSKATQKRNSPKRILSKSIQKKICYARIKAHDGMLQILKFKI